MCTIAHITLLATSIRLKKHSFENQKEKRRHTKTDTIEN